MTEADWAKYAEDLVAKAERPPLTLEDLVVAWDSPEDKGERIPLSGITLFAGH